MIDDALRLTIDEIFETKYSWDNNEEFTGNKENKYMSPYQIENYSDDENLFLFVCNISN